MHIEINGRALDLGTDFGITINRRSPIFNDLGSTSVTADLPDTGNNRMALKFAGRLDAAERVSDTETEARIVDSGISCKARVNVTSAARGIGASVTFGFDNSVAYEQLLQKGLKELRSLPVRQFASLAAVRGFVRDSCREEYDGSFPDDVSCFPICVNYDERQSEILNAPVYIQKGVEFWYFADGNSSDDENGSQLDYSVVPENYAITPFVRVWRVLELIFEDLGVKVVNNPFKNDLWLARLVVLNNTADSCVRPVLAYKDLMPDVTVSDFLNALWVRFGMVYSLDYDSMEVDIRFLRDILSDEPAIDLTNFKSNWGQVTFEKPEYLVLAASNSIEGSAPLCDRWEDFIGNDTLSSPKVITGKPAGADRRENLLYDRVCRNWFIADNNVGKIVKESNCNFSWDPATPGLDRHELSSSDCVPYIDNAKMRYEGPAAVEDPRFAEFSGNMPMYLAGRRHAHTAMISGQERTDEAPDTPLAFMFDVDGKGRPSPEINEADSSIGGSGNLPTLFFQFRDGHFDRFWRKYDEILRFGNRTFEVECRIPRYILFGLDILRPVTFDGVRCLIDTVTYDLPAREIVGCTLKLRPIQTQGEYNISTIHVVPSLDDAPRNLYWVYNYDDIETCARKTWQTALKIARQQLNDPNFCEERLDCGHVELRFNYGTLHWEDDPRNSVGTFPGDTVKRSYRGSATWTFYHASTAAGVLISVTVDFSYNIWLYCVYEGMTFEPRDTPKGPNMLIGTYETIEDTRDENDRYMPDPDDMPDPWDDDRYWDDYWDDRDW